MTVRVTQLDNGMRVATDAMATVETVSLGAWVETGARDEAPEINGISHLLERTPIQRSCLQYIGNRLSSSSPPSRGLRNEAKPVESLPSRALSVTGPGPGSSAPCDRRRVRPSADGAPCSSTPLVPSPPSNMVTVWCSLMAPQCVSRRILNLVMHLLAPNFRPSFDATVRHLAPAIGWPTSLERPRLLSIPPCTRC